MSLADDLKRATDSLRDEASRMWNGVRENSESTSLSHFLRPNLGPTPPALRTVLEPVVAASAMLALFILIGVGAASAAGLMVAAAAMYAIITYVFGIELGFDLGRGAW